MKEATMRSAWRYGLWSSKNLILGATIVGGLLVVLLSLPGMHHISRELMLVYFQPFVPINIMLWLWVYNLCHWEAEQIEFESCFSSREKKFLPHYTHVAQIALWMTAIGTTLAAVFATSAAHQMYRVTEFVPLVLYCAMAILLTLPLNVLCRTSRQFFADTIVRVLLPLQEVSWADFLLADMFTSLSKSSQDFARATCLMGTGPVLRDLTHPKFKPSAICDPLSPLLLAALCLPYLIRLIQCIIVWYTTGNTAQLFNAAKYCSAFPALILSSMEHEAHSAANAFPFIRLWLLACMLQSSYSFYWDVEMDWDMPWLWQRRGTELGEQAGLGRKLMSVLPTLKPDCRYMPAWYTWLCLSNMALRLTWMHRMIGDLENHGSVALLLGVLEVFRRFQWVFVRVETELRKIHNRVHGHSLSMGDLRLSSTRHNPSAGGAKELINKDEEEPPQSSVTFALSPAPVPHPIPHGSAHTRHTSPHKVGDM